MHWVFNNNISFKEKSLRLFRIQAEKCEVYKRYLQLLNVNTNDINSIEKIPFLPIEFFKSQKIITTGQEATHFFKSSGTGPIKSTHFISDIEIYIQSFMYSFERTYGSIKNYRILALLPHYLENGDSSLVFMANHLIKESNNHESGFYLHNIEELSKVLNEPSDKKTILLGVSYALLDLAKLGPYQLKNIIVMETGGMKGKRKEMTKSELHNSLSKSFGVTHIHSEYGMTEMLSQAYAIKDGVFDETDLLKILIRDPEDPFNFLQQQVGGVNIIDLANVNSCAFIATQDLGKKINDHQFEILGRFDLSDVRGCNLLVQ